MFASATHRAQLIAEKAMTVLHFHSEQHPQTPIDMFASEPFDFDVEFAAATIEHVAPHVPLRIVRLQTLLHMKRQVGRPQDLADVAELSRIHEGRTNG
jgi:acyl carrier protein phosphodiesterase